MGRPPTCAHMVAMQRYVADHRHTGTNVPYPIDSLLGETPAVVLHLVVHQIPFSATTDGIYKCFVQEIPITWYNYNALLVLKMAEALRYGQQGEKGGRHYLLFSLIKKLSLFLVSVSAEPTV